MRPGPFLQAPSVAPSRWLLRVMVVLALAGLIFTAWWVTDSIWSHHGPKSDAERIAAACGGDPHHLGWIEADGTVCCDLCSGSSSA
jgi:hypothetical protein